MLVPLGASHFYVPQIKDIDTMVMVEDIGRIKHW